MDYGSMVFLAYDGKDTFSVMTQPNPFEWQYVEPLEGVRLEGYHSYQLVFRVEGEDREITLITEKRMDWWPDCGIVLQKVKEYVPYTLRFVRSVRID